LVTSLKVSSLWQQWDCIYPFVGGTSNSCSWNLVNPNLYRMAWTPGSSTFNAGGWMSDGVASFGNTQFNPATANAPNYGLDSVTLFVYNGTHAPSFDSLNYFIGAIDPADNRSGLVMVANNQMSCDGLNSSVEPGDTDLLVTNFTGPLAVARQTGIPVDGFFGGGVHGDGEFNSVSTGVPSVPFYIGARNDQGQADSFIGTQFRLVMIGGGLSDDQVLELIAITRQFETTLGRP
jgi:hypothetical protein